MDFDLMKKIGVVQNIPKVNFTDYTGLIVGIPKIGKTTIASLFPRSIIIPFEIGFQAQVVNVAKGINTWVDFIGFIDKLEKHRGEIGNQIQTLVFDTVNEAYDLCLPYMLQQESKKAQTKYASINDVPYGQGWGKLDQYFKMQIDRLQKLGFAILFLSHSKVKTIKPKNGEPYDVYSSTMSDRLEKIIYPLVDYIIFAEKKRIVDPTTGNSSLKRVMIVSGNDNDENCAGSRVSLKTDIIFDTEEEAVSKFQAHFQKAIEEKLRKAGITKDISEISKEQEAEKNKEVNEYIESQKVMSNEEMVAIIKSNFATTPKDVQAQIVTIMKENNVASFESPDDIPKVVLQKIIELF